MANAAVNYVCPKRSLSRCILLLLLPPLINTPHIAQAFLYQQWIKQPPWPGDDGSGGYQSLAIDSAGNSYVSGASNILSGGSPYAFVARFDSTGASTWTRQLATSGENVARSVSLDSLGNVLVVGETLGSIAGPSAGGSDTFVFKYDSAGNKIWATQVGTSGHDQGYAIRTDSRGNIYIAGRTSGNFGDTNKGQFDAFTAKLDASGQMIWKRQLGSAGFDEGDAVAIGPLGDIYVTGEAGGNLDGTPGTNHGFIADYNASGDLQWARPLGSVRGAGIATDALGNIYVSGAASNDAVVAKFDSAGNQIWSRQYGSSSTDAGEQVALDGKGSVYLSGFTGGNLDGTHPGARAIDGYIAKYDSDGNFKQAIQLGTSYGDEATDGIVADGNGHVYLVGFTTGAITGPAVYGNSDLFLAKFFDTPTGDFNGDGKIDLADYVRWRSNNGSAADYATWRTEFGTNPAGSASGTAQSAAVPEPFTLALIALGAVCFIGRGSKTLLLNHAQRSATLCLS